VGGGGDYRLLCKLALRRAGLVSEKDFLAAAAKAYEPMQNTRAGWSKVLRSELDAG